MFPTLGHLFEYLFGTQVSIGFPTFGFMVALAFVAAAYIFTLEIKRKEQQGLLQSFKRKVTVGEGLKTIDAIGSGIFGFVVGFKLVLIFSDFGGFLSNPQQALLSTQGNVWGGLLGAAVFIYIKYREIEKQKLPKPIEQEIEVHPHELISNITVVAAISGIIGAKIFHNLEYWEEFMQAPIEALISSSGLTFYGGLICGAASVWWYLRKFNYPFFHFADAVAPGLILAYGIGRIGCQLSGDGDWGIVNNSPKPSFLSWLPDWMWSFTYPHNVAGEGVRIPGCEGSYCYELPEPVWPTPFYETIMALIIFLILWQWRHKMKYTGQMFFTYLIFNGVERFLIEKIRVNAVYDLGFIGITQAEIISSLLIIIGIAGLVWIPKNQDKILKI